MVIIVTIVMATSSLKSKTHTHTHTRAHAHLDMLYSNCIKLKTNKNVERISWRRKTLYLLRNMDKEYSRLLIRTHAKKKREE